MKKPVAVSAKLSRIEGRVPHGDDYEDLMAMASSIQPSDLDAGDQNVARRIVTELHEAIEQLPAQRRALLEVNRVMRGLVPGFEPTLEPVTDYCAHCDESFQRRRSDARYCSARCRVAAKRLRDKG